MRWQQLFADLAAEFEAAETAAERAEDGSRRRAELGAVRFAERVAGSAGMRIAVRCRGAGDVAGTLADVGSDWLLLVDDGRREVLVALAAVRSVAGLGRATALPEPERAVRGRLDLRRALRGLARDRAVVQVVLDDGSVYGGTVDGVGADYVELAEHDVDQPRRAGAVRGVRAVVLPAVAVVRTLTPGLD
ncbi:hypothetical protein [Geodermatophilus sabuli]|uniref:Fis family transcriptional regulator n=1 Tax=Geodermatophilus sabuli TaxID=1564158 RepID=A0A285EH27_9ACTN|nr:hypothetical protein [Geodermatophilus sabuli]MBB3086088.1 hypothetical protein [Geodermatophilus sabuli]SNX98428.1 hypothetical protein SAMN06893097_110212 [Geodermatophilus sabuli]